MSCTSCRCDGRCQRLACSPVDDDGGEPWGRDPPWNQLLSRAVPLCASLGLPVPHAGNELPEEASQGRD